MGIPVTKVSLFAATILIAAVAFLPVAAATEDLPSTAWVKTCGYKGANECESFCILGLWVGTEPDSHTEVCVVPNCACYIGSEPAAPGRSAVVTLVP